MVDYKRMYLEMVKSAEDAEEMIDSAILEILTLSGARRILQESRRKCEMIFIETDDDETY